MRLSFVEEAPQSRVPGSLRNWRRNEGTLFSKGEKVEDLSRSDFALHHSTSPHLSNIFSISTLTTWEEESNVTTLHSVYNARYITILNACHITVNPHI